MDLVSQSLEVNMKKETFKVAPSGKDVFTLKCKRCLWNIMISNK